MPKWSFKLRYREGALALVLLGFFGNETLLSKPADRVETWLAESQNLISGDKEKLPALQKVCRKLLRHPSATFLENGKWKIFVENVAVASIGKAATFDTAMSEAKVWMDHLRASQLGNRSERATLGLRLWKRVMTTWADRAPEAVRAQLNLGNPPGWDASSRDERQSWSYAEAAVRTKWLDEAKRGKTETTALERELVGCLKKSEVPQVSRIANTVHCARLLASDGACDSALARLEALRREKLAPEEQARVLNAIFFICWFGKGDRNAARQILHVADDLVAQKQLSAQSPEMTSLYAAYYRGLLLTSDQLRTLNP